VTVVTVVTVVTDPRARVTTADAIKKGLRLFSFM
jgi:hypothetical protein